MRKVKIGRASGGTEVAKHRDSKLKPTSYTHDTHTTNTITLHYCCLQNLHPVLSLNIVVRYYVRNVFGC